MNGAVPENFVLRFYFNTSSLHFYLISQEGMIVNLRPPT